MRVWLMVLLLAGTAQAQSISFGSSQDVYVGTAKGLFVTHDAGATWRWTCPAAVGYSGIYAPDYQGSSTSVFATTFDGAKVMRDGCSFASLATGQALVSEVERAPNGDLWLAVGETTDSKLYKSTDDGATFPVSISPGMNGDWWEALVLANDSSPWVSGYRLTSGTSKLHLLAHGASQLATTAFQLTDESQFEIVGVHEMEIYVRVTSPAVGGSTSTLYHGNDLVTWQVIRTKPSRMSFLLRKDGTLLVATDAGLERSNDHGATWTPITCAPSGITCLAESPTGELWACTSQHAVVRTSDLVRWSFALDPRTVAGPALCAPGTVQHDTCEPMWTALDAELDALTVSMPPVCVLADDAPPVTPDAAPVVDTPEPGGCCSGTPDPGVALALLTFLRALSPTRRRMSRYSARRPGV